MAAYVIISVRAVRDPEKLHRYREGFDKLLSGYGGRRMIATDKIHVLEGEWRPARLAVYEFDNLDLLQSGYSSEEYQPLKRLRQEAIDCDIVVVEGL